MTGADYTVTTHASFEDAMRAASQEAAATMSQPVASVIYQQGGRQFIVTSFPLGFLVERVKLDTMRRGDDPDEHINRPLMRDHVRAIVRYLTEQPDYILPAVTLSMREPLRCHVPRAQSPVKLGFAVLPVSVRFDVTDGQHRIKALEEALHAKPGLADDAIAVTIAQEARIDKVHQDFVDCAQVKPIPPALLTAFNLRDPLARLTREIIGEVRVFRGRIEKAGRTVGKSSINLFTMNQVRAGLAELLTGDSMQAATQLRRAVEERIPDEGMARQRQEAFVRFFEWFTDANSQWSEVAQSGEDPARDKIDSATLRQRYVHFTATGLLITGRVGHHILKLDEQSQPRLVRALAQLDWSRRGKLWEGNVATPDGKVVTSRLPVETAIAKVKETLGMALSEKDTAKLAPPNAPVAAA
jgi:DNA sulfur modification protein DndB